MEPSAQQRLIFREVARIKIVTAIWGEKYSEQYVDALKAQIPGLIVLRENEGLYQPGKYRDWFCKIEILRPENRHLRPCLFVDLDTFVIGNIAPILELDPNTLWMIKNFFQPARSESGLFIAPKDHISDLIWERAESINLASTFKGDGDFLSGFSHRRITDVVDRIYSYKADHLEQSPRDARIVCFHGQPKPLDLDNWARDFFDKCSTQT